MASAFALLAEPARRQLLDEMLTGPKAVNALVEAVGMSQPVVSKHLRILRDAGMVSVRPDGQKRVYSVNPAPLGEVLDWLEPYRRYWAARFDDLERHLDSHISESEND